MCVCVEEQEAEWGELCLCRCASYSFSIGAAEYFVDFSDVDETCDFT